MRAFLVAVRTIGVVGALALCCLAIASQNNLWSPTTGTVSGLNLTNNYNSAIDSINQQNSGAVAPTNQLSGSPSEGNLWLDTSVSPKRLKWFDGSNWVIFAILDDTNHLFVPVTGGGTVQSIASASTTDLCSSNANFPTYVSITGTTTITSFGSNCQTGQIKVGVFTGALTLTHNASSLILPNAGNNIATTAGDVFTSVYLGGGNWRIVQYMAANGQPTGTLGAANVGASMAGFAAPLNLTIATSVATNALTITIQTAAGGTPSATSPVVAAFADPTVANGDPSFATVTAALSMTISAGNTMGCQSAIMCRLWVFLINNGGSIAVCAYNANSGGTSIIGIDEANAQTSASGTAGGSSAQTLYCSTSAVTNKSVRYAGYIDIQEATAGTWASAATSVRLFGPGIKKPGEVVKRVYATATGATTTTTATKTITNTVATITPASAANVIYAHASGFQKSGIVAASDSSAAAQMARSSASTSPSNLFGNLSKSFYTSNTGSNASGNAVTLEGYDSPNTTSATQYSVYTWNQAGGTASWLGTFDSDVTSSVFILEEIMGALEPANDNALPLSMVG